tara:strand:+ start:551 stop:796 length:246 start_codon:yes stop_codon:yes gene_type:complete
VNDLKLIARKDFFLPVSPQFGKVINSNLWKRANHSVFSHQTFIEFSLMIRLLQSSAIPLKMLIGNPQLHCGCLSVYQGLYR